MIQTCQRCLLSANNTFLGTSSFYLHIPIRIPIYVLIIFGIPYHIPKWSIWLPSGNT